VLVCQPTSHPEPYEWVEDMERWDGCAKGQWHAGPACRRRLYPYRIARVVPLTAARRVGGTVIEVWEQDRTGQQLYHNAWFTDLAVSPDNVAAVVRMGRSRWKIEHEQFHGHKTMAMHSNTTRAMASRRCRWCLTCSIS